MQLKVRCTTGDTFTVEVEPSDTVITLKQRCATPANVAADQQRLIFKGRILKDEQTLESYGTIKPMCPNCVCWGEGALMELTSHARGRHRGRSSSAPRARRPPACGIGPLDRASCCTCIRES